MINRFYIEFMIRNVAISKLQRLQLIVYRHVLFLYNFFVLVLLF